MSNLDDDTQKEELELLRARKQVVAQRSDLVQNGRGGLTRLQKNALRYMISKVKPTDTPNEKYTFSFREFSMLMRYKSDSYTDIKTMLQTIGDISWWRDADNPDDDDRLLRWLNIVHVNEKKGTATISFHEDIFPYILNLQEQYEHDGKYYYGYMLQNVSLMKGLYSADLYELLRSYANNSKWVFEIGTNTPRDIQRRLARPDTKTGEPIIPESWKNWAIFKRDVLEPAKKEINLYSDIVIDYIPSKIDFAGIKHRRYVSIEFQIDVKTSVEQKYTENIIDAEYREIEDNSRYNQLTLQDVFVNSRNAAKEEAENVEKTQEAEVEAESIDEYKYPMFKMALPGFKDEELDFLYEEALKHLEAGRIGWEYREIWAVDYVSHYYDMVKATMDSTRTTPYKRLLDMVRKDYEDFAPQINAYDGTGILDRKTKEKSEYNNMSEEDAKRKIAELEEYLRTIKE